MASQERPCYFDGHGVCDPIQWIFAYGSAEFNEVPAPIKKVPRSGSGPQGGIKALVVNGPWGEGEDLPPHFGRTTYTHSRGITRMLAKRYNLVPENAYLAARCEKYVDCVQESVAAFIPILASKEGKGREEKLAEYLKQLKLRFLDRFELIVKANGGKYVAGSSLTWTDFYLAYFFYYFQNHFGMDLTQGYPNIGRVKETVLKLPQVQARIENRKP